MTALGFLDIHQLRAAIHDNRVTFPSEIPVFTKQSRAEIQWRLVSLYFVRGWSYSKVARRYGFGRQRAHQLISQWTARAVALGYIQEIPPTPH